MIIDEDMANGVRKGDDVTYAAKDYVEAIKDTGINLVYYHYIQPMHRKDGWVWRTVNA